MNLSVGKQPEVPERRTVKTLKGGTYETAYPSDVGVAG